MVAVIHLDWDPPIIRAGSGGVLFWRYFYELYSHRDTIYMTLTLWSILTRSVMISDWIWLGRIHHRTTKRTQIQKYTISPDRTNRSRTQLKKFLTPHTRVLDLSLSEDEILSQMHEKWRYNIRLAAKRGVEVERVAATVENIDIWMGLLMDTLSRDGFAGNSRHYYESFIQNLAKTDQWWLYFAWFEGRVIAGGIFVFTLSRAIYYYGASSSTPDDRKQMAPYLLQWTAICDAKNKQIPLYDFLGVADPADPDDSLRWVTEFKEKFGGVRISLPPKVLYPLSWKYGIFLWVQKIKNLLKRR
jgi:lipid II:glycine glycyltransferase (peptidoglycan interpeptide bridge formation enzyme)